jgi:NADH-quinone oxidoreductase subunit J
MDPTIPYTASVLGAIALYLLVRPPSAPAPRARAVKVIGLLLGFGVLAWVILQASKAVLGDQTGGGFFYIIFSFIAVAAAVRMITTSKPVYAALYFILVVLSSAGLFLLLAAEFMAFALIIVYAGAILITYLFVLMLAQQSANPEDVNQQADYDVLPREPAAAVIVGFVLLALFTTMIFDSADPYSVGNNIVRREDSSLASNEAWRLLNGMPSRVEAIRQEIAPNASLQYQADGTAVYAPDGHGYIDVLPHGESRVVRLQLPDSAYPDNIEQVGWALIAKFPVSLELAGVILLMAMFGAVVLARRQIELGEAELHAAAGIGHYVTGDEEGYVSVSGGAA